MTPLETQLVAKGVGLDVARACAELFGSYEELQLSEWVLDASITGLDLRSCRKLMSSVLWAVQANAHKGEALWRAAELLGRLTNNIVACGNSVEKYRTIRKSNPKIREALDVMAGGEAALLAAGFREQPPGGDTLVFPSPGAAPAATAPAPSPASEGGPDLRPLTVINSKLQQLGFTGSARENDDTGSSTRSRHSALPGFRYQHEIFECSCCGRPINDGSDRLVTRRHDAPHGEFRYECERCEGYNLCEQCWDKFIGGSLSPGHPRDHPFQTHHPKASQHNLRSNVSDTNPWGVVLNGASAARARERLKQRTGL
ncbi:hypothetical protein GPECTOR_8g16 [Gonium pectorale]|uniref:Uncharacterized protein n=1 Tax=Gonium pectorale TaxID=33097 RepID=A0A150GTU3_GONPE|nr:hypothetical protein GPECTOR_8g16 [Gonium pectorale]|eukprot:KXZ52770.1 hypothetical protein GPECTOR_8g16 [Gonium pectorale]